MSTQKIFAVVVCIIIGVILVMGIVLPMIMDTAYDKEVVTIPSTLNEDPVGDLRLAYVPAIALDKYVSFADGSVSKGDIAHGEIQTADYQYSPTADMIVFASDSISVSFIGSSFYLAVDGTSRAIADTLTIRMEDKLYVLEGGNTTEYTYSFVYYPDAEGTYANYLSYTHDNGDMYATGSFAGISVSFKDGEIIGENPLGLTATVEESGEETTGVHYEVTS